MAPRECSSRERETGRPSPLVIARSRPSLLMLGLLSSRFTEYGFVPAEAQLRRHTMTRQVMVSETEFLRYQRPGARLDAPFSEELEFKDLVVSEHLFAELRKDARVTSAQALAELRIEAAQRAKARLNKAIQQAERAARKNKAAEASAAGAGEAEEKPLLSAKGQRVLRRHAQTFRYLIDDELRFWDLIRKSPMTHFNAELRAEKKQ